MKREIKAEMPLEYVRGFTEFLGCKIDLSQKPLIPRPETEFWVAQAINDIKKTCIKVDDRQKRCTRVLDIFSGSGCVGVAVLAKTGILLCDMADSQNKCLKQARINLELNGLIRANKKIVRVIKSDVFSNIKNKYDYILANPPYVALEKKDKVQKSVLEHEPHKALFAGEDGMKIINKFLKQAKNYLNKNGKIYMEFSPEQKNEIDKILKKENYKKWEFHRDQFNRWRWVVIQ